ncbi:FAD:protein FMN transferase [Pedobacter sandarakinus]|uniref:FAD:protein FMN transferase n=1 Tax=Pedobacter sandarakinus TaxID=353156 RepID=UPI002247C443|nr:FAD:protein FMN transferase [Pedobacter sandarakinus]
MLKPPLKQYKISGYAQGTDYSITYFATDSAVTKSDIDNLLNKIDASMSLYKPGSLINQFNTGTEQLHADLYLSAVLKRSIEINQDTKGLFDVTVAPLVQAWGFGPKATDNEPSKTTISSIMQCIGMQHLSLKNDILYKSKPCIQIDLNGIAQGYSVDLLAKLIADRGIDSYLVELGGELRIAGPKPDGSPMKIGIEGPDQKDQPIIRHIAKINRGAITTSGNYRKFHQNGMKKLSHLIDPRTGFPLDNEMISVTVYASDAITADGYDNALMAMHLPEAMEFVNRRKALEAYFVYRKKDGSIADTLTVGFKKLIQN